MHDRLVSVLEQYPHPVAAAYARVHASDAPPAERRLALIHTAYQALRVVGLPLAAQYLGEPAAGDAEAEARAAWAIAGLRSPSFRDWVTLVRALARWSEDTRRPALFPGLGEALRGLDAGRVPSLGPGSDRLPLEALQELRNWAVAHGPLPDPAEAARHVETYLPILHQVLSAFGFLARTAWQVGPEGPPRAGDRVPIMTLRGLEPATTEETMDDARAAAFVDSRVVVVGPAGATVPLGPLVRAGGAEPVLLYEGHCRRSPPTHVVYLGTFHKTWAAEPAADLHARLSRRGIDHLLDRGDTTPWTVADAAADHTRRVIAALGPRGHDPNLYAPPIELERTFETFLAGGRRNGLIFAGPAGAGKTAFLARQAGRLLDGPDVVLLVRAGDLVPRPAGPSLFLDVARWLGVAADGGLASARGKRGFGGFRELFARLDEVWGHGRVRRLVLLIDAVDEAPDAETVFRQALEVVRDAAGYSWCRVVLSVRREWLGLRPELLPASAPDPLQDTRPHLFSPDPDAGPVVAVDPLPAGQARELYNRYFDAHHQGAAGGEAVPACRTVWGALPEATRELLRTPLHLRLFMEAFDGRLADPLTGPAALFRCYVDQAVRSRPGLDPCVAAVVARLLAAPDRQAADLTPGDHAAVRGAWAAGRSPAETAAHPDPVQALVNQGWLQSRPAEEGGGFRFTFRVLAEYLVYRHLGASRPAGEDEVAYWAQAAGRHPTFPEYAGAFAFLFRDWAAAGALGRAAGQLDPAALSAGVKQTLLGFLIEQAHAGFTPDGGGVGLATAHVIARAGSPAWAHILHQAAYALLARREMAPAAVPYLRAAVSILARGPADGLEESIQSPQVLGNLGLALHEVGDTATARVALGCALDRIRRLREIFAADPYTGHLLVATLTNLSRLERDAGDLAAAERSLDEAVRTGTELWDQRPRPRPDGPQAGAYWRHLGGSMVVALEGAADLLRNADRVAEACKRYEDVISFGTELLAECEPPSGDDEWVRSLVDSRAGLGELLTDGKAEHHRAIDLARRWWATSGGAGAAGLCLASILNNALPRLQPDAEVGIGWLEEAWQVLDRLVRSDPGHTQATHMMRVVGRNLAGAYRLCDRTEEADVIVLRLTELGLDLPAEPPVDDAPDGDGYAAE